ncbi:MAG: nascent polypeptide-associated complex protein [Thermoprotei archaeon]|nr:MAG: nascent polypeptide-associated complex protein [Thermoprotei archaeon]
MRRISPREYRRLMKRLGMRMEELKGVIEARIVLGDRELVFNEPKVSVVEVSGQRMYWILGTPEERAIEEEIIEIREEDIELVATQAGVSREEARRALLEAGGDLAKAILILTSKG